MNLQLNSGSRSTKALIFLTLSLISLLATTQIAYSRYTSAAKLSQVSYGTIAGKFSSSTNSGSQQNSSIANSSIVVPTTAASLPAKINIPDIGVDAQVEHLGLTAENAVDVPKSLWTTAWFNQSSRPGDKGPAMIVGHYSAYGRAVFANLKKLNVGQKIVITDDKGQQFTFAVTKKGDYPQAQVPMAELLGNKNSKPRLEIITCGGGYIKASRDFTNRTVITAEIIDA
jgi:sortase (surface protein transpeptidase)